MEKICKTCHYWQPNGGLLGVGYCTIAKFAYRKPSQSCNKWEDGTMSPTYKEKIEFWEKGLLK